MCLGGLRVGPLMGGGEAMRFLGQKGGIEWLLRRIGVRREGVQSPGDQNRTHRGRAFLSLVSFGGVRRRR